MNDKDTGLCGCGRPTQYISMEDLRGSCNKRQRCPSYEELRDISIRYSALRRTMEKVRDVSAEDYEYRTWAKASLEDPNLK